MKAIQVPNDQSMTCDVWPQQVEVRCAVATCDVHAEPILVVTCDVHVCGAFSDLRSVIAILYIFGNNEKMKFAFF